MSDPKDIYAAMSREQLEARLKLAEDVCVLVGWCSTNLSFSEGTDRGDAAGHLWSMWASEAKRDIGTGPDTHTDLVEMTPSLAESRRRIRKETLGRIDKFFAAGDTGEGQA